MSSVSTIPASPLVGVNVDQCERLFVAMFSEPENKVALEEGAAEAKALREKGFAETEKTVR